MCCNVTRYGELHVGIEQTISKTQHGEIEMGMGGTAQETDQTCTMAV